MKRLITVGDKVRVFNRYLFAVPQKGTVIGVAKKDNALKVVFLSDNKNVLKHDRKLFFQEECSLIPQKQRSGFILFINGPFNGVVKSIGLDKEGFLPREIRCGTEKNLTYILNEVQSHDDRHYC